MLRSILRYGLAALAILLLAYHSVYFKKLDEVKAARMAATFDAATYAREFWERKLTPNLASAVDIDTLLTTLNADTSRAFNKWSHALGIGNLRYFLVRGSGTITAINEDDISVALTGLPNQRMKIATEFIFGNAVRDASGMIDINDFSNTMDFNNVSAEINKIIRVRVLPELKKAKTGDRMAFTGAIELNKAHVNLSTIEAIPVNVVIAP